MTKTAIIIGAGIGGLSAGIALQQAGFSTTIYERVPQVQPIGAGIALWANALKALDQLGVGDNIRALGTPEVQGGFHTPDGSTLIKNDLTKFEQRFGRSTLVLHRSDLSQLLTDAFTGTLHTGKVFTGCDDSGDDITAKFTDGTQAHADVLICADGIHSVLRQAWFPTSQPRYAGYMAWRGVVKFDHAAVGAHWGETLGRGLRFGIAPLSEGRIYWYCTQNLPETTVIAPEDRQRHLLDLFGGWYDPIPALIRGVASEAILQNSIADLDPLTSWVRSRAALLGDSAHAMTPNMGQGGCQAIEDAVVLGKCLRAAASINAGLQAYEQRRLPHANQVVAMSRRIGQVFQIANPLVCGVRNLALRVLPPSLQMNSMAGIVGSEV